MGCLLEGLLHLFLEIAGRIILLPVLYVAATPFILLGALFGPKRYGENVQASYTRLTEFFLV
jgi:hypothetical protein